MRRIYFILTFFFLCTPTFVQYSSESKDSSSIFYGVLKAGIETGNIKIVSSEGNQLFFGKDKIEFFVNVECMLRLATIFDCGIGIEGGIPRGMEDPKTTVLGGPAGPEFYFVPVYAVGRINLSRILALIRLRTYKDKYVYLTPKLGYTVLHGFDGFENFTGFKNISDLTYFSLGLGVEYYLSKGYGAGMEIYFASNRGYMKPKNVDSNDPALMVRHARIGWNFCFAF